MAVDLNMNVLIVDDYKTMLRIIENLLNNSVWIRIHCSIQIIRNRGNSFPLIDGDVSAPLAYPLSDLGVQLDVMRCRISPNRRVGLGSRESGLNVGKVGLHRSNILLD